MSIDSIPNYRFNQLGYWGSIVYRSKIANNLMITPFVVREQNYGFEIIKNNNSFAE